LICHKASDLDRNSIAGFVGHMKTKVFAKKWRSGDAATFPQYSDLNSMGWMSVLGWDNLIPIISSGLIGVIDTTVCILPEKLREYETARDSTSAQSIADPRFGFGYFKNIDIGA
jgi:hypothetical protein